MHHPLSCGQLQLTNVLLRLSKAPDLALTCPFCVAGRVWGLLGVTAQRQEFWSRTSAAAYLRGAVCVSSAALGCLLEDGTALPAAGSRGAAVMARTGGGEQEVA